MGDIGVVATEEILDDLKNKVKENKIKNPADCKQLLIDSIKAVSYTHLDVYKRQILLQMYLTLINQRLLQRQHLLMILEQIH